jgi:hypothetical protein
VALGFDRQGWITVFAALLLALITLFTNYTHVDLLGGSSIDLPQQAQCNLVQLRHQLEPSERNARRVQDVISLLEEYGGLAG